MNYKAIPLLLVLAVMIVPLSNIPIYATDAPLNFGVSYTLNTTTFHKFDDQKASLEDGMHWLWHQDTSGIGLYYAQSTAGENHSTIILIQGLDNALDAIDDDADLIVDGTTVYVFYAYSDQDGAGEGKFDNLYVKKSIDNGATFGAKVLIADSSGTDGFDYDFMFGEGIVAKQDIGNGDLYVFFKCGSSQCDTDENTIGLFLSEDAGATWSKQTDVAGMEYVEDHQYDPYFQASGIHVENGVIQIAFELFDDAFLGDYVVQYNSSVDKGETWKFGFEGDDGSQLTALGWDDEASDSVPVIIVAGSTTMVMWHVGGDSIYYNRSTDLGLSWQVDKGNGAETLNTGGFCDNTSYQSWNVANVGSYTAFVCASAGDLPLVMIDSQNLGGDWNSAVTLVPNVGVDNQWINVNVDVNANNMAFSAYYEEDDLADFATYIIYAQDPMSDADFVVLDTIQLNGKALNTGGQMQDLPHVNLMGNSLFFTWWLSSNNNLIWYEAPLTNSGIAPADTTAPVITPDTPQPITLYKDEEFFPLNFVSAVDETDGDLTQFIMVEINAVNTAKTGIYTVGYEVVDMAMNIAMTDIEFFVKKKSGGSGGSGSFSSDTSSGFGQVNTLETLEDVKPIIEIKLEEQKDLTSMFADIFKSRLGLDGETVSPDQTLSVVPSSSDNQGFGTQQSMNNVVSNFFADLFSLFNFFG